MAQEKKFVIRNCLRAVLVEKGKSMRWLATELDVDYQTIQRYGANTYQPPIAVLERICDVLDVHPMDILIYTSRLRYGKKNLAKVK